MGQDAFSKVPPQDMTVQELKALGRKKIIELAKEKALEAGSHMVPADEKGVQVLVGKDSILVSLSKGYRAYTDGQDRVIVTIMLQVRFQDHGPTVSHEGDDILTDADRMTLEFVLKKIPQNYQYTGLSIVDNPQNDPNNFLVKLDNDNAMGRHSVDRKSGEWTYITHKHYARTKGIDVDEWSEMK